MDAQVWTLIGVIVSLLLSGNIYFIKKLVEKVENTGSGHEEVKTGMVQVNQNITWICGQLQEIKSDVKGFRRIEIEIEILKAQLKTAQGQEA